MINSADEHNIIYAAKRYQEKVFKRSTQLAIKIFSPKQQPYKEELRSLYKVIKALDNPQIHVISTSNIFTQLEGSLPKTKVKIIMDTRACKTYVYYNENFIKELAFSYTQGKRLTPALITTKFIIQNENN